MQVITHGLISDYSGLWPLSHAISPLRLSNINSWSPNDVYVSVNSASIVWVMSNHSIITLEQTLMIKMWKFSFKKNTWKCVQWCLGENGLSDYSGGTAISLYIASCWILFKVLEQIQATACMYKIIVESAKSALWFYFSLRTNTRHLWTFAIFIIIYTKKYTNTAFSSKWKIQVSNMFTRDFE